MIKFFKIAISCILSFLVFSFVIYYLTSSISDYVSLKHRVNSSSEKLNSIEIEKMDIEHQINLLHPSSLDLDALEEFSKQMLNLSYPEEKILIND